MFVGVKVFVGVLVTVFVGVLVEVTVGVGVGWIVGQLNDNEKYPPTEKDVMVT